MRPFGADLNNDFTGSFGGRPATKSDLHGSNDRGPLQDRPDGFEDVFRIWAVHEHDAVTAIHSDLIPVELASVCGIDGSLDLLFEREEWLQVRRAVLE